MSDNDNRFKNHLNRLPNTPLIYQAPTEGAVVKNLLLIDKAVADNKVFSTSVNSDTFPITYSYASDRSELLKALQSTFTTIDRIGIVSEGCNTRFLNMKSFFDNAQFLISVIKEFGVKNIDFLACSSLTNPEWVNFYTMLNTETGVVVGASNDATGNIKYGGDWVMESTRQDIEFIYFTEGITYYQYLLDPVTINGLTYNLATGIPNVATVVGFVGSPTNLVIPSSVDYGGTIYTVTTIGDYAFQNCTSLTSVTIPDSVTTIETFAFSICTSITSVTIGNSLTTIGPFAFVDCASLTQFIVSTTNPNFYTDTRGVLFNVTTLIQYPIGNAETTYTIPSNVTTIGDASFAGCTSLTSFTIPDSVTTIGYGAFAGCASLASITIPGSLTTIGDYAFQNCTSLAVYNFIGNAPSLGTGVFDNGPPTAIGYYNANNYTSWQPFTQPNTFGGLNMYGMFFGIAMRDMFTFHIHHN